MTVKLPPQLRTIATVATVRRVTVFGAGLAKILPGGSLLNRVFDSLDSLNHAATTVAEYSVDKMLASGWCHVSNSFVTDAVHRFGVPVLTPTRAPMAQVYDYSAWDLAGHLVLLRQGGHRGDYWMSSSTLDQLIAATVKLTLAGTNAHRLFLTEAKLAPETADFSLLVADDTAEMIRDLQAEFAAGERSRTILLVGPPGSGKSTAARQIAASFAATVLAVDGSSLNGTEHSRPLEGAEARSQSLAAIVRSCGAGGIVVDDYDRRGSEGDSLALISALRSTARVIVFTANDEDSFSGAEERPGRFDKIMKVRGLDRHTAMAIAPNLPAEIAEEAWGGLLAAYLHELSVLCRAGRVPPRIALDGLLERQRKAEKA